MRRTILVVGFLLCGGLLVPPVGAHPHHAMTVADDSQNIFTVIGYGATSCGDYLRIHSKNPNWKTALIEDHKGVFLPEIRVFVEWVNGFLTAVNREDRYTETEMRRVDFSGTVLWIKKYCEQHPLDALYQAADRFVAAYRAAGLKDPRLEHF